MTDHRKHGDNASVLHVQDGHQCHFVVVHRNCEPWEPGWCCVREGSGREASAIGMFFDEAEAQEFASWKNGASNDAS